MKTDRDIAKTVMFLFLYRNYIDSNYLFCDFFLFIFGFLVTTRRAKEYSRMVMSGPGKIKGSSEEIRSLFCMRTVVASAVSVPEDGWLEMAAGSKTFSFLIVC